MVWCFHKLLIVIVVIYGLLVKQTIQSKPAKRYLSVNRRPSQQQQTSPRAYPRAATAQYIVDRRTYPVRAETTVIDARRTEPMQRQRTNNGGLRKTVDARRVNPGRAGGPTVVVDAHRTSYRPGRTRNTYRTSSTSISRRKQVASSSSGQASSYRRTRVQQSSEPRVRPVQVATKVVRPRTNVNTGKFCS